MLLIKLYPNKNKKLNKNHGLEKVSLSLSKQKTYYKKFLKTQSKFWYDRCRLWYIYEINNQKQKQLIKINFNKITQRRKQFENIFLDENGISNHRAITEKFNIILLTMLKSYLKTWVKQITNSKTTLKIQTNTICS